MHNKRAVRMPFGIRSQEGYCGLLLLAIHRTDVWRSTGKWYLETLDSKDSQEHFEYLDKNFGVCLADDEEKYFIPAWSLHRLIEMALRFVLICGISFNFNEDAYEKVIGIIEYLIDAEYFNKEYLEE